MEYLQSRKMTVQDAFLFLDTDGSGFVTWDEFLRGVSICVSGTKHSAAANPTLLANVFRRFDLNKDNLLSVGEFTTALAPRPTRHDDFFASGLGSSPGFAMGSVPSRPADFRSRICEDVIARLAASMIRRGISVQTLFSSMDLDRNTRLSRPELERAMLTIEPHLSRSETQAIFERFDKDGNGTVDLNEFSRALQEVNARALVAVEDKVRHIGTKFKRAGYTLHQAFSVFDRNGDGFLSLEEWQNVMRLLAPDLSSDDVEGVFRRFDRDNNAYMSVAEFQEFFQNAIDIRMLAAGLPAPVPVPEAAWEAEVLDLVANCLSEKRSGLKITEVFRRLDISNSNSMTQFEFHRMIRTYRSDMTTTQMDALFRKVNISGSGAITLGEFVRRFG